MEVVSGWDNVGLAWGPAQEAGASGSVSQFCFSGPLGGTDRGKIGPDLVR